MKFGSSSDVHLVSRVWWSTLSKALLKSMRRIQIIVSGTLSAYFHSCTSSINVCTVDVPFIDPYCLGSTWMLGMPIIQSQMAFSRHFDKTDVREIGRKSLWMSVGGLTLGIGRMSAHFHSMGTVPSRILLLKIAQTGGARMVA